MTSTPRRKFRVVRAPAGVAVVTEDGFSPALGEHAVDGPADQQQHAARHGPPSGMVVMMIVVRVIVADVIAGVVRVRGQAGGRYGFEDCSGRNAIGVEGDVDAPADQIEIEREDARRGERVADQRRFVGAVHARDMEANLRAAGRRQGLPRRGRRPSRRPNA